MIFGEVNFKSGFSAFRILIGFTLTSVNKSSSLDYSKASYFAKQGVNGGTVVTVSLRNELNLVRLVFENA